MKIDTDSLKDSQIGHIVLFYSVHPKVTLNIKRIAEKLVTEWSRPILGYSRDYHDRQIEVVDAAPVSRHAGPTQRVNLENLRQQHSSHARMRAPKIVKNTYTIAPREGRDGITGGTQPRLKESEEMKTFKRRLTTHRQASRVI